MSSLFFPVNKWGSPRSHIKAHIAFQFIAALPKTLACSTLSMFVPSSFWKVCRACSCSASVSSSDAIAFSIISISSKVTPVLPVGIAPLYVSCNLVAFGNLLFFFTGRRRGLPHIINFRIIQFLKRAGTSGNFVFLSRGSHSENRLCFLFGGKGITLFLCLIQAVRYCHLLSVIVVFGIGFCLLFPSRMRKLPDGW